MQVILDPIVQTVAYYFAEPTKAGVPYEGGWLVDPTDTDDMLYSVGLQCHDELFEDIVYAFMNDAWVPAAGGHWASSHLNKVLEYSWYRFTDWIKHETRFFFTQTAYPSIDQDPQQIEADEMLPLIARLVHDLRLITVLPKDKIFYRVRERAQGDLWTLDAESIGAPPTEQASAGRMNPTGISYLYLALEETTAIAEVVRAPPAEIAVAEFQATRDLKVLEFTNLPALPSIFDDLRRNEREGMIFLGKFVQAISEPIIKDGRDHISYVPSQVVSEFFALMFKDQDGSTLDGVAYPSSLRAGGGKPRALSHGTRDRQAL